MGAAVAALVTQPVTAATEVMERNIPQGTTRKILSPNNLCTKESVSSWATMSIPIMKPDKLRDIPRLQIVC